MGSDVSHFNVSLVVRGKVSKAVSIKHNCWREREELKWNWDEAPLLTNLMLGKTTHDLVMPCFSCSSLSHQPAFRQSMFRRDRLTSVCDNQARMKELGFLHPVNHSVRQKAVDSWWKINRRLRILDGKSTDGCGSLMENQQKAADPWWKINRRLWILDGKSTEGKRVLMFRAFAPLAPAGDGSRVIQGGSLKTAS